MVYHVMLCDIITIHNVLYVYTYVCVRVASPPCVATSRFISLRSASNAAKDTYEEFARLARN